MPTIYHNNDLMQSLKVWLPGLHTTSLNRTKGRGWIVSYKQRQTEACALVKAIEDLNLTGPHVTFAKKVLVAISAGVPIKTIRAREKPPKSTLTGKATLHYIRCTTRCLDIENFAGSTKGMTDCLRYAVPWLLPDDDRGSVDLTHSQERVEHEDEQGTWVILSRSNLPASALIADD
jgi:hypothetical protein